MMSIYSAPKRKRLNTYGSTGRAWGSTRSHRALHWDRKNETLTGPLYHRLLGFHLLQTSSQKRDKKIVWGAGGGGAKGLQWLLPLLSHSPLNHLSLFIGPIWTEKLALLPPGWRPCLLKSEFHLACAKPSLQGEISCWKPGGCWRTGAAVCIL